MPAGRDLACVFALAMALATGCSSEAPETGPDVEATSFGGDAGSGNVARSPRPGAASSDGGSTIAAGVDPATATHPEVVYVLMDGKDGLEWFCTGTLVSKDVVVTAAHCLEEDVFLSWEIVAPTVAGTPRVMAKSVAMYDEDWSDVAHPDLGIVRLAKPISLAAYAVLTDVGARVDGGQKTLAAAVVRKGEEPEAPLGVTGAMPLSSTAKYGYAHGYGVPLYSHGGDSGAGLFLVANGQMTHQLVAVERQPEPARKLDHLTRVDAAFIDWVAKNGGG